MPVDAKGAVVGIELSAERAWEVGGGAKGRTQYL